MEEPCSNISGNDSILFTVFTGGAMIFLMILKEES